MLLERDDTMLPPVRKRKGRNWGRLLARVVCGLLAIIGLLPVFLGLLVRSNFVRSRVVAATEKLLREQHIEAKYELYIGVVPFSLELRHVRVESTDGGEPAVRARRIAVRPKILPLLSGQLRIDQVEVLAPKVRLVVRDGRIVNLAIPESKKEEKKPIHSPVDVFAVTDGLVDIDIDGVHVVADDLDVDVTAKDDRVRGSTFEIAVRGGVATVERTRLTYPNGEDKPPLVFVDEDVICSVDGRIRLDPDRVFVRRLAVEGFADLDGERGTIASCKAPKEQVRRVTVNLNRFSYQPPDPERPGPLKLGTMDGHVNVRAPVALLNRIPGTPETDGFIAIDLDTHLTPDMAWPDVRGQIEAHDLRVEKYRFASEIASQLSFYRGAFTSPETRVRIADGTAILRDIAIDITKPTLPLSVGLDAQGVDFAALMRDLGVSKHPHVTWGLDVVRVQELRGTLNPFRLDGEVRAKTTHFGVYDSATDDPNRQRIIGFREADLSTHVHITDEALTFTSVNSTVGKSRIDNASVVLGFHEDLRVDVPHAAIDLSDISPLVDIPLAGRSEVSVKVQGKFTDPSLEGDVKIAGFSLSDIPFGDVDSGHVRFSGDLVDLEAVRVTKGASEYRLDRARLDFGQRGMTFDGVAASSSLHMRDFFSLWHLEDDPRFAEIDGVLALKSNVHLGIGSVEDKCGSGYIEVNGSLDARKLSLLGETFDSGTADFELKWFDRNAGLEGADVALRSITLVKRGRAGRTSGSVLGSAAIRRGGDLRGNLVLEAIPLSRINMLDPVGASLEGSLSGLLRISNTVDAFVVDGDIDVTPVRYRRAAFGASSLHVNVTQAPSTAKVLGTTPCGGRLFAPFDKEAYVANTAKTGDITVRGALFNNQIELRDVAVTRQKAQHIRADVALRGFELGQISAALSEEPTEETQNAVPETMGGVLTGDLKVDLATDDLSHAQAQFAPRVVVLTKGDKKLELKSTDMLLVVDKNALSVPPLIFELSTTTGLRGGINVGGRVERLTQGGEFKLNLELLPVDLGVLVGTVPRVTQAEGSLTGQVQLRGKTASPDVTGLLRLRKGEFAVLGLNGFVSEVELDLVADEREFRIENGHAKYGGGDIAVRGRVPMRGLTLGQLEASVIAKDVHVVPTEGIKTTFDANLAVTFDPKARASLPQITGDVVLSSFEYTRPMFLDLSESLKATRTARTVVDAYDPSQDAVRIDLALRARSPLRIKNNLVELGLLVDTPVLSVSGTNQRLGLRGVLKAAQGGRFRYLSNDFEITQATIRFDDPTRVVPKFDVVATTEYKRYSNAGTISGAGATSTSGLSVWRIRLHAYGEPEDMRIELSSEPPLSREDIALLLTVGLTRAEIDQVRSSAYASAAFQAVGALTNSAVKDAIPVIDDFRFGSAYSPRTGRTEPQVTVGKRLSDNVRASVSSGVAEDRLLRTNVEWRLNRALAVIGSYNNASTVNSQAVGNVGVDFRFRLEFE